jgi:hypothetical protein
MKKLFAIILLTGIFLKASSQQPIDRNQSRDTIPLDSLNKLLKKTTYSPSLFNQSNSYSLPNGDKVVLLSLDNMPCVVPNSLNTITICPFIKER